MTLGTLQTNPLEVQNQVKKHGGEKYAIFNNFRAPKGSKKEHFGMPASKNTPRNHYTLVIENTSVVMPKVYQNDANIGATYNQTSAQTIAATPCLDNYEKICACEKVNYAKVT